MTQSCKSPVLIDTYAGCYEKLSYLSSRTIQNRKHSAVTNLYKNIPERSISYLKSLRLETVSNYLIQLLIEVSRPLSLMYIRARVFTTMLVLVTLDRTFPSCFLQSVPKTAFEAYFHANQTHFHMKAFAPGLVLKQRYKITQSWRISFNQLDICKETKTKIEGSQK